MSGSGLRREATSCPHFIHQIFHCTWPHSQEGQLPRNELQFDHGRLKGMNCGRFTKSFRCPFGKLSAGDGTSSSSLCPEPHVMTVAQFVSECNQSSSVVLN